MTVHRDQRWSTETEQGVVVAVYRAADTAGYGAMPRPDGVFDPALRDARAALAYLADSGRLLPDGGETRTEYASLDHGEPIDWSTKDAAVRNAAWMREADDQPAALAVQRTVYIGPWEPVHD